MTEQLQTMSGIIQDFKGAGQAILEDEQAMNVIRALPDTNLWRNFSLVMAHHNNIKTFNAILKHLKMKGERQKLLSPPSVVSCQGE